jgi:Family of unknown function (DUF6178)
MTTELSTKHLGTSSKLLARLLEAPALADQIQSLPPAVLAKLVDHVGLEDAGEIVALATTEQLETVFDDHLWTNDRPGVEERFDDERFVVWLEAMLEAGDALVAEKLSELPEDLVALAFHRRILVVPLDALMNELGADADDADATEKALSNRLSEEFDEYQVIARGSDGWDAVLATLLALDRDHHDFLARIFERCAARAVRQIDDYGGLYGVLTSEEMLENDVAADREDRRTRAGFVAPRAAAAFLELAKTPSETPPTEHDPLTRAYFRDLSKDAPRAPAAGADRPDPTSDLGRLLGEAGVTETSEFRLLAPANSRLDDSGASLFVRAMKALAEDDRNTFAERSEELAYISNVLVAACTIDGRRVRPIEAVQAAIAICDIGLGVAGASEPLAKTVAALREHPTDGLFRLGWPRVVRDQTGTPDLGSICAGAKAPRARRP